MFCMTHRKMSYLDKLNVEPVWVGITHNPGYNHSHDTGDNIAWKNNTFAELTGQYWVWKNIMPKINDESYLGFCHYRRFFENPEGGHSVKSVYCTSDSYKGTDLSRLENSFKLYNWRVGLHPEVEFELNIKNLPRALIKGLIRAPGKKLTIVENYQLRHYKKDLIQSIDLLPSGMREAFKKNVYQSTSLCPCNMYVTKKNIFNEYFEILFPWLFKCEQFISCKNYNDHQRRVFGFLAERFSSFYFRRHASSVQLPVVLIG